MESPGGSKRKLCLATFSGIYYNILGMQDATNGVAYNNDGAADSAYLACAGRPKWVILTGMADGTNVSLGISDTRTASLSSTASGNNLTGSVTWYIHNYNAAQQAVEYGHVLHYNTNLSEDNRKGIETRLAFLFGITLPY